MSCSKMCSNTWDVCENPRNEVWRFTNSSQLLKSEFLNLVKIDESEWGRVFKDSIVVSKQDVVIRTTENIMDYDNCKLYNDVIAEDLPRRFAEIAKECNGDPYLLPLLVSFIDFENSLKLVRHSLLQAQLPPQYGLVLFSQIISYMAERVTPKDSLDLLKAAYMWNSDKFVRYTIPALLLDEMSREPLLNFVKNLGKRNKNMVMAAVAKYPLSTEGFLKHVEAVCILHRDCDKTIPIQAYVQDSLLLFSDLCRRNKTYGRLLLSYIESAGKDELVVDYYILKVLVKTHQSVVKKACEAALWNYRNENSGESS